MPSIRDLIDKEATEKTVWVNYVDRFDVQLKFLPRPEIRKIMERSKFIDWDRKDHTKKEGINSEKFNQDFAARVLVGWRGLDQKTLAKLIPLKVESPDLEIPFSVENAISLIENAYDFDSFLMNYVTDIEHFQSEQLEQEIKNSGSSQAG